MTQIIGFAGKKRSGKNTACNFILATKLIELGISKKARLNKEGLIEVSDILGQSVPSQDFFEFKNQELTLNGKTWTIDIDSLFENELGEVVRIYALADPIKKLCLDLFNLTENQVYGNAKHSWTSLLWENMPGVIISSDFLELGFEAKDIEDLTKKFGWTFSNKKGKMKAREVMQFVGTELFRKIDNDIWIKYLMRRIDSDSPELALVSDVRFANEVAGIKNSNGHVIYLTRGASQSADMHESENALPKFSEFFGVIDNSKMNIAEQNQAVYEMVKPLKILPEIN